jgi:hypothetical protein
MDILLSLIHSRPSCFCVFCERKTINKVGGKSICLECEQECEAVIHLCPSIDKVTVENKVPHLIYQILKEKKRLPLKRKHIDSFLLRRGNIDDAVSIFLANMLVKSYLNRKTR